MELIFFQVQQQLRHVHERGGDLVRRPEDPQPGVPHREGQGPRHRDRDHRCLHRQLQVRLSTPRRRRHRTGESDHALPWSRQHPEDKHVPQRPQEADPLNRNLLQLCRLILFILYRENKYVILSWQLLKNIIFLSLACWPKNLLTKFCIPNTRNFVFVIFPYKYLEEIFEIRENILLFAPRVVHVAENPPRANILLTNTTVTRAGKRGILTHSTSVGIYTHAKA